VGLAAGVTVYLHFVLSHGQVSQALQLTTFDHVQLRPDLEMEYAHLGCQIFLGTKYQNGKNIQNYHELYQVSIKYNKRP
jgi:hypothetical protein